LRDRKINVIFSVDLFNEGLDIPEIDTVLFLRPTESATVFLQQLGRGLRRSGDKSGLTVLDFIGQQHRQFRFEPRLTALTGAHGHGLIREIEAGFPSLPAGCSMQLDRIASATILDNIRSAIAGLRRAQLAAELRSIGDVPLSEFIRTTGHGLDEVYRPTQGGPICGGSPVLLGRQGQTRIALSGRSGVCNTLMTQSASRSIPICSGRPPRLKRGGSTRDSKGS
jgi:hypothetical protein